MNVSMVIDTGEMHRNYTLTVTGIQSVEGLIEDNNDAGVDKFSTISEHGKHDWYFSYGHDALIRDDGFMLKSKTKEHQQISYLFSYAEYWKSLNENKLHPTRALPFMED